MSNEARIAASMKYFKCILHITYHEYGDVSCYQLVHYAKHLPTNYEKHQKTLFPSFET